MQGPTDRYMYFYHIINIITIISLLWSNLIWAGGLECYKLSTPSQVTSLVPIADAFATGQDAIRRLADAGVETKEEFYGRLNEVMKEGKIEELAGVPVLVFSDKDDPGKLSYYVFTYREPYFSRITTHPEVNDSLWSFLGLSEINERAFSEEREFAINGKKYYQRVYALDEKEREFIGLLVNRVFDEKPMGALCGIGYSKEELNGIFYELKSKITRDENGVNIVNEESPYIAYLSPAKFVISIIDNNGGVYITSGLKNLLSGSAPYLLNAILRYRKTGLDDKVYDLQGKYLSEEVFLLYGEGGEPLGDRVLGFIKAVTGSKFGVSAGTVKYDVLSGIIRDVRGGRKNGDSDTLNKLLRGDKKRNELDKKDISSLPETLEGAEGGRYGDIVILPSNAEIFVIGDTHGDSESTKEVIKEFKERIKENKDTYIVFLGDYVNNGLDSIGNLILVLGLRKEYPENVILLNGNHEFRETYMTVLKEFFETHWDNADKKQYGAKDPKKGTHYGHIRLELIKRFGVEEGERLYRLFEEWGRSLPYLCLSKSGVMMSHSIGLLKGQEDVTLENLALGKEGDWENIEELGYEAWKKVQATMHSAMVNNRNIDGGLLKCFERLGIKYFVVGHTHYRSSDMVHPNAPEINDKLITVCSSRMDSPTAGHYMYQEMVVESNTKKPDGKEGARHEEKRKGHASPCWVKFERNSVTPIVVEIEREFKKSNDGQGGGSDGDIVYSHMIDEKWKVWKVEGCRVEADVEFFSGDEKIGEGRIDIDPTAASINTCWFESFREGQHLGLEMAGRMYVRAYEISKFLGLGTRYAHAYYTLSKTEELETEYRSAEGWKKYWEKKEIQHRPFKKLGLEEKSLEGKRHLDGIYGDRYLEHVAHLEDVVGLVEKNWQDWFYSDRISAVLGKGKWEQMRGRIGQDKTYEEMEKRINLSRQSIFSQILDLQLKSMPLFGFCNDIKTRGALVFDIDGTLLKTKGDTLGNNPEVRDLLIQSLRKGFIIGLISGNSRFEQRRRIVEPIYKELEKTGKLNLLRNFIMYVNGCGTKIEFNEDGEEVSDNSFNTRYIIPEEHLDIMRKGLTKCLIKQLGLNAEEKGKWKEWFSKRTDFPGIRFTLDWMDGKGFDVPVLDSEDIFNMMKEQSKENLFLSPWIETRDGVQLSIKLLPKEPRDVRDIVIREIQRRLSAKGLKNKYVFRKAGFASIDITLSQVDKTTALRDLIQGCKLQNRWTVYFGNEFYPGGNDEPIVNVPGVSVVLVDKEPEHIMPDVKGRQIWQVPNPEGVWDVMKKILKELDWERDCAGGLVINRAFSKEDLEKGLIRLGFSGEDLKYLLSPLENVIRAVFNDDKGLEELRLPIVINKDVDKPVKCLSGLILINPLRLGKGDYQAYLEGLFYMEIVGHYLRKLPTRDIERHLLEYMSRNPTVLDGTIRVLQKDYNIDNEDWLNRLWELQLRLISEGKVEPIDTAFRDVIEVFLGVSDIVGEQRLDKQDIAKDRAIKALRAIAGRLNEYLGDEKGFSTLTQEEFNRLFGVTQIVAAGGLGTRYDPTGTVHKGLGGLKEMMDRLKSAELLAQLKDKIGIGEEELEGIDQGEPNIRIAMHGTYKSPGTVPVIVIEERILLDVLNEKILDECRILPSESIRIRLNKLKGFISQKFPGILVDNKIQHLARIPEDWMDKEKKARLLTRDGIVLYAGYNFGHGDVLIEATRYLQAIGMLEETPYKELVFSEMAEAILPSKTNAGFITYLEALANPNALITVGTREGDSRKEDITKKGHLFLKDSRLIAYTDYGYIPEVRKEGLRNALDKLGNWDSLGEEEEHQLMRDFAITETGNLLISANCSVFKNEVIELSKDFLTVDELGNKVGFRRDSKLLKPNESIYTIDPTTNKPSYLAWDLVEFIAMDWDPKRPWPISYVSVGNAPASIKDIKRQIRFADAWQRLLRQLIKEVEPSLCIKDNVRISVYLGEDLDMPLRELIMAWLSLHNKEEVEGLEEIHIKIPENYFYLLKIYGGDRERLLTSIKEASEYFGISLFEVVSGLFSTQTPEELQGRLEMYLDKYPSEKKKIVAIGGGSGLLGLIYGLRDLNLITSVQANIDDGGSSYLIVKGLEEAGYGILPAPGDPMNLLFKGFASQDKLDYLMDDQGRIHLDKQDKILVMDDSGRIVRKADILQELLLFILTHIRKKEGIPKGPGFIYFASTILNLAQRVDGKYLKTNIIPREGGSIRNLMLIGVLDYLGILSNEIPRPIGEPTISNDQIARLYDMAIDLIAYISDIRNARISLSHYVPGRVYAIYDEYCIFVEGDIFRIKIDRESAGIITEKERYKLTLQNPQIEFLLSSDLKITVRMEHSGSVLFKINGSHWIELIEPLGKSQDAFVSEHGLRRRISEDGTGRVYDPKARQYLPIIIDSRNVYIRGRFIASQTNITETANYSKIVEFGLADKTDTGFTPAQGKRLPMNNVVLKELYDPATEAIVIGPGSFFTSILPHFLVEGFDEALSKAECPRILVVNSNIDNEILGYTITELLEFIEKVSGYKINQLFDSILISRFDYQKLEEYKNARLTPKECVELLKEEPDLIQRLGLDWTRYIIGSFIERYGIGFQSKFNVYGSALKLGERFPIQEGWRDLGRLTIAEYLEYKFMELRDTLTQPVGTEIRTDPGSPSVEGKKSRGPLLYTREEMDRLKERYPSVHFDYDLSIAGCLYGPTRSRAWEPIKPYIRHIPSLLGKAIQNNMHIFSIIKAWRDWYNTEKVNQSSLMGCCDKLFEMIENRKTLGFQGHPKDIWYICEQTLLKEFPEGKYSLYMACLLLIKAVGFEELALYLEVIEPNLYKGLSKWFRPFVSNFHGLDTEEKADLIKFLEEYFQIPDERMNISYKKMLKGTVYSIVGYVKEWGIDSKDAVHELDYISSLEQEMQDGKYPGVEKVKCHNRRNGETHFIYRQFEPGKYEDAFRSYDVRAIVDPELMRTEEFVSGKEIYEQEFSDKAVYYLAMAYAQLLRMKYEKGGLATDNLTIAVGMDVRKSSERLKKIFIDGLLDSGINVIDIGLVSTPITYFASLYYQGPLNNGTDGAVMITASHNPPSNNGFKPVLGSMEGPYNAESKDIKPPKGEKGNLENWLSQFKRLAKDRQVFKERGEHVEADREELKTAYKEMVKSNLTVGPSQWQRWVEEFGVKGAVERVKVENIKHSPLKGLMLLIDPLYGTTGEVAKGVFQELGAKVFTIHYEPDGLFPGLSPDPIEPKNLKEAYEKLLKVRADIAIGLDNDGDRIGAVYQKDSKDEYLQGDQILAVILPRILKEFSGGTIVYDVKCSDMLSKQIKSYGGIPLEWKTGHANIKAKMRERKAIFGGEQSGHIYQGWFGENGFFDDSLQAAVLFLGEVAKDRERVGGVIKKLPIYYFTRDLRMPYSDRLLAESENLGDVINRISSAVEEYFKGYRFSKIDGSKIYFTKRNKEIGWGLIRFSGTEKVISSRVDAVSEEDFEYIKKEIYGFLKAKGFVDKHEDLEEMDRWAKEVGSEIDRPYSVELFLEKIPIDKTILAIDIDMEIDAEAVGYMIRLLGHGVKVALCDRLFLGLKGRLKDLDKEHLLAGLVKYTSIDEILKRGEVVMFIGDSVSTDKPGPIQSPNLLVISLANDIEELPRGVVGFDKGLGELLRKVHGLLEIPPVKELKINPDLFKMDIRGIADTQLGDDVVERIGKAYSTFLINKYPDRDRLRIVIGRDNRGSSKRILSAFIKGVISTDVDVIDIGLVPVSILFFGLKELGVDGGVMVTGGHLGKDYNGLKPFIGNGPLSSEQIMELKEIADNNRFKEGEGKYSTEDVKGRFYDYIKSRFQEELGSESPLIGKKIVVDCANGPIGLLVPKLLEDLGATVVGLDTDIDGEIHGYPPDAIDLKNLRYLVKIERASLGIVFSGDGGALAIVDEEGNIVSGDNLTLILLNGILEPQGGTRFVAGSAVSSAVVEYLKENGGECILTPRAYTEIRERIIEMQGEGIGNLYGGDISGHFLFPPQYLSCGVLSMLYLFKALTKEGRSIGDIISDFPYYISSEEIRLRIVDYRPGKLKNLQRDIIKGLKKSFLENGYIVKELDGIRIEFPGHNSWVLIRPSVTLPEFSINAEAPTITDLKLILIEVRDVLKNYKWLAIEPLNEYIEYELFNELPREIYFRPGIDKAQTVERSAIEVSLIDTIHKANMLSGEEGDEYIKGLIDKLTGLRYSWHIRKLALRTLGRIAGLRPELLTPGDMYRLRIIFENEDISADYTGIQSLIEQDKKFLKEIIGRDAGLDDIRCVKIQYYDRGANKQIYRLTIYLKNGDERMIAITPIRENPSDLVFDGLTREKIEESLENWNELARAKPDLVPRVLSYAWEVTGEGLTAEVGPPFGILRWDEETLFLAREFIEGITLQEILESNLEKEEKQSAKIETIETYLLTWLYTLDNNGKGLFLDDPNPTNVILYKEGGKFRCSIIDIDYMSRYTLDKAIDRLSLYKKDYTEEDILDALTRWIKDVDESSRKKILSNLGDILLDKLQTRLRGIGIEISPPSRQRIFPIIDTLPIEEAIYVFDIDGVLSQRNLPMEEDIARQLAVMLDKGLNIRIVTGKSREELDEKGSLKPLFDYIKKIGRQELLEDIIVYTSDGTGKFIVTREGRFIMDLESGYSKLFSDREAGIINECINKVVKELEDNYKLSAKGVAPFMRNFSNLKYNFSPYGTDKGQYDKDKHPERPDRVEIAEMVMSELINRGVTNIRYEISGATTIGFIRRDVSKENAIMDIRKDGEIIYFGDEVAGGNDRIVAEMAERVSGIYVISVDSSPNELPQKTIWWGGKWSGTKAVLKRIIGNLNHIKEGPDVISIGGGNGPMRLAVGMADYTVNMKNIITVFDNGGSTGVLREHLDIPAVGDMRNRIVTLLNLVPGGEVLEEVFDYRFPQGKAQGGLLGELKDIIATTEEKLELKISDGIRLTLQEIINYYIERFRNVPLEGMCVGNIILAGEYFRSEKDLSQAVKNILMLFELDEYMSVMPVSESNLDISARLENEEIIYGEHQIIHRENPDTRIEEIFFTERGEKVEVSPQDACPEVFECIREADAIVIGPGSLYTSCIPNLLVKGIREAIRESKGVKILVVNLLEYNEREGVWETKGYKASDIVNEVLRVLKEPGTLNTDYIQYVLVNNHGDKDGYIPVDISKLEEMGLVVIVKDLEDINSPGYHDTKKLSSAIMEIISTHSKQGPIGKRIVEGDEFRELFQAEVENGELNEGRAIGKGEKHPKYEKIDIDFLRRAIDKLIFEYGPGILAVVDAIRVVDNISANQLPGSPVSPYASVIKENGKNILLLDADAFESEELLYIVLEHELKESMMNIVPCENEAVRELTTNFMSLKLALEKGIKMEKSQLAELGLDLQFFEALEVLQAMADVTDEEIIAAAIEHMKGMPYYAGLFRQFSFVEEWEDKIKDAENRYEAALRVFNEIAEAKEMASKVRETKVRADRKIKRLSESIKKVRMVVSTKLLWEGNFVDTLLKNNKFIRLDRDELNKPENKYIMDWINRITKGKEKNPFIFSDEDIPDGVNPEDIIYLIEPERVNAQLPQNRLYLSLPYSVSSIYLASKVVLAGGKVSEISDKLAINTIKALYETLLGRGVVDAELEQLFRTPWTVLPPIAQISVTLNTLRKAIQQIEVSA